MATEQEWQEFGDKEFIVCVMCNEKAEYLVYFLKFLIV